ncbi:tyrosine-type recombinase/integrase [Roseateles sp. BYS96W]|uniref:Tyrosine-type recombinase/integrase n=1 Tax=Pelomonas nitida TaxID=3299027 RepID=A0ABW7G9U9_9BURK
MKSSKVKLTVPVVKAHACPAGTSQLILWDTEVRGLGIRALPDHIKDGVTVRGAKTYVFQGRVKGAGIERRITIGRVDAMPLEGDDTSKDEARHGARQRARKLRNMMDMGRDPQAEQEQARVSKVVDAERTKAEAVTLDDVRVHYIANKKTRNGPLKANTIRDINIHVDKSFAAWKDKPIKAITRAMCEARHAELARGGLNGDRPAPTSARGAFVILRALINWAMDKYRVGDEPLIRENPVRVLKGQMAPPRARSDMVPMERIGHVWEALRSIRSAPALPTAHTQADVLAFMLLTGARKEETLGLTWDRVDLRDDAGSWHLPDSKNGRPWTFPLSAPARALIAARPRRKGCEYVFQAAKGNSPIGVPRGAAMRAVIEAAGCAQTRHSLRATFTTLALNVLRIDLDTVELLTGHVPTTVVNRHYRETSDLRWAAPEVERIGAWIVTQANIAAGRNVVKLPRKKSA